MLKNLFDQSERAITCMGILGFAFSAPLLWLMIKVGVGTVVTIPSMASNVKDSSLGFTMLFIRAVASLFIIAGVWGFFGRRAGIIVSIILACVYWKTGFHTLVPVADSDPSAGLLGIRRVTDYICCQIFQEIPQIR